MTLARIFAPTDIAPLVYARIVFGALMAVEVGRFFAMGWISEYYIEPTFFFAYPGFEWVRPLPGDGMYVVFGSLGILSLFIALGLFYRAAAALFALGISYVFLLDQTNYLNHMYLICLLAFLFAAVPAGSAGSLDALRLGRSRAWAPAWALWLLQGQIGLVYFFGAVAKLEPDWLSGHPAGSFLDNTELTSALAASELGRKSFAAAGLLFDLLIVPALLWRRTRWPATAAAVVFHLSNHALFRIGIFPWLMLALTPLFYPPAWVRSVLARARILGRETSPAPSSAPRRAGWIVSALAAYAMFQLLFPLRHWLYPGDANWTEEGHNFSWHMKLRVKRGTAEFVARDPRSNRTWKLELKKHLTSRQRRKMATRPEMLRQLAAELRRREASLGRPEVEIRARAMISLNGRPPQLLVDPEVDLSRVERTLGPATWIVPLEPRPAGSGGPPRADDGD